MTNRIGFIGLGKMGRWMAINLLKNNFNLIVFDTDDEAVKFVADYGARTAKSIADVTDQARKVFFCLPNHQIIENIVIGNQGLIKRNFNNHTLIDLGTSNFIWTQKFSERLGEEGISFSDAPVTGMEQQAKDGILTIMFGGKKDILDEITPVLTSIGNTVVHMGPGGSGRCSNHGLIQHNGCRNTVEDLLHTVKISSDMEGGVSIRG